MLIDGQGMSFKTDDAKYDWMSIADDFILKSTSKKRIEHFVKNMHNAKMETERKMRQDLD